MAWGRISPWSGLNMSLRANASKANVMLSYPIDEAESLLDSKRKAAKLSLSNCEEDLDFLREQITVIPSHPARLGVLLTFNRPWR